MLKMMMRGKWQEYVKLQSNLLLFLPHFKDRQVAELGTCSFRPRRFLCRNEFLSTVPMNRFIFEWHMAMG
uniref:HDC00302 n=1 Tax=Drosophila melanogaster TaxID=7227 RepID=Q6IHY9_DROME|nr:TPA_inf: HDC00302 [Drosophila melanogaster]